MSIVHAYMRGASVGRRACGLVAALALLLLTIPATASAETTAFTESFSIPITPGFITCEGETVFLEGDVHLVIHGTLDSAGGVHAMTEENFAGVHGYGLEGGALYVATDSKRELFNGKPDAAREDTFERSAQLVAQGRLSNAQLHVIGHITTNANGEPVVDFISVRFGCRE
jgi:hypothetical protein